MIYLLLEAMELVSAAASHFESMMLRDVGVQIMSLFNCKPVVHEQSRIGELVRIQRLLLGDLNLVSATRSICKQGKINTINAKTTKKTERMAFLVRWRR